MCSNFADADFHMIFVVYVSAAKYVSPQLLIIPRKWFIRDVIKGCNIESSNIITAQNIFINSTLFLICIELFANSIPDSVTHLTVLV